ncbi:MAG: hypothetical protein KAU99_01335 [Thermoplasmata archaeon]|nr:hypothetical protein [Thermoplasmata archaeon]
MVQVIFDDITTSDEALIIGAAESDIGDEVYEELTRTNKRITGAYE